MTMKPSVAIMKKCGAKDYNWSCGAKEQNGGQNDSVC